MEQQHTQKPTNVYNSCNLTRKITLPITSASIDSQKYIRATLNSLIQGKCIDEGFVKPDSVHIETCSSGKIHEQYVTYTVGFECQVFYPVTNSILSCKVVNITMAGIRAESSTESPSPFTLFIFKTPVSDFSHISEGDVIDATVLLHQFELNDSFVSIIGELYDEK